MSLFGRIKKTKQTKNSSKKRDNASLSSIGGSPIDSRGRDDEVDSNQQNRRKEIPEISEGETYSPSGDIRRYSDIEAESYTRPSEEIENIQSRDVGLQTLKEFKKYYKERVKKRYKKKLKYKIAKLYSGNVPMNDDKKDEQTKHSWYKEEFF